MAHAGIIFDGDDTLWDTMPLYRNAKDRFLTLMTALGFCQADVSRAFDRNDESNVATLGFSRGRFPASMVQTYREFCRATRSSTDPQVEHSIAAIGDAVFDMPITARPSAPGVLRDLRVAFTLVLATKGDTAIQERRIAQSGLEMFFDRTYILGDKSAEAFRRIVRECALVTEQSWSVGNSVRSDIVPALEIGLKAAWVPSDTWNYEDATVPQSPRVVVCRRLAELPAIINTEK